MNIDRLEELKTIRSDLRGNVELIIRTDDGEFNWNYGRELLEELLDAEIVRQSVTDEAVQRAITVINLDRTEVKMHLDQKDGLETDWETGEEVLKWWVSGTGKKPEQPMIDFIEE